MKTQLARITALAGAILLLMLSCGKDKNQYIVQGTISNADTLMLYLEKREHTTSSILDSVRLDASGDYKFKQPKVGHIDFFRLRLNNQDINFAIDSTETITINANKETFASNYTIEGSFPSEKIKETIIAQRNLSSHISSLRQQYAAKILSDNQFIDSIDQVIKAYKENATKEVFANSMNASSYFTIFQKIDDYLIFDIDDKADLNLFRAVATAWKTFYPESPRTKYLEKHTLEAISRAQTLKKRQENLEEIFSRETTENDEFYTVSLPDINGKTISSTDLRGKVVLLDFTAYRTEFSLAHNIRLKQVYDKHKSKLEIYQISFDADQHAWRNAASNLPWTCVRDKQALNSTLLPKFNIEGIPTTYVLDKKGNLIERISCNKDLETQIIKHL